MPPHDPLSLARAIRIWRWVSIRLAARLAGDYILPEQQKQIIENDFALWSVAQGIRAGALKADAVWTEEGELDPARTTIARAEVCRFAQIYKDRVLASAERWTSLDDAARAVEQAIGLPTVLRDVLPWCGGVRLRVKLPFPPAAHAKSNATTLLPGDGWSDLYRAGAASIPHGSEMAADGPCSLVGTVRAGLADVLLAGTDLDRVCAYLRTKNYASPANRTYMATDIGYTVLDIDPVKDAAYSAAFGRAGLLKEKQDEIARVEALHPTNLTEDRYKAETLASLRAEVEGMEIAARVQPTEARLVSVEPRWVTTSEIKAAFRDLWPGDIDVAFNKPNPWLLAHRKMPGRPGKGGSALWDPIGIAADLKAGDPAGQRNYVPETKLRSAFLAPALKGWQARWTKYLEDDRWF